MLIKMMRVVESKNILLVVLLVLCAGLIGIAQGAPPPPIPPGPEPYVSISFTPGELDLGSVLHPGTYDSPATLLVQVAANCPIGAVMASTTPLQHPEGNPILPERIFIQSPATGGFVSMAIPVGISAPTTGPEVFDINVQFQVEVPLVDLAGTYNGTMTFTIGPP